MPAIETLSYGGVEMCGRFTLRHPSRLKFDHFNRSPSLPLVPRYNIAPSQNIVAILQRRDEREAALMQWGLIPSWSKDAKGFINARSETITGKPSFSESFQTRRCLIPADGFYEWQRSGKIAQPYYFQLREEMPFTFAGIWDEWSNGEQTITSCAIITTSANELLATIHDRMPVILPAESHDEWLNDEVSSVKLESLLMPFPAREMIRHAVSYDVNHTKIDDEHLVLPVEPNIGVTLSLF
ncbi:MAG TPA: SOS response-associated peptidase [Pyrinomonadaceae bacterium]|nr:SOS response-associated peptidase [Pyrinomonadaceae bacterium]